MDLAKDFVFQPLPPIPENDDQSDLKAAGFTAASVAPAAVAAAPVNPLGRLADLQGKWQGTGFNVIWRPMFDPRIRRFLELNVTSETLEFEPVPGPIANRGLLQKDIVMHGLSYLQQISDKNLGAGLHFEPGIWAHVPSTSAPKEPVSIVRMATIPHGTAIVAQGSSTAADETTGPDIPKVSIIPFTIGDPKDLADFPESNLKTASKHRTAGAGLTGVTQAMMDDPNSVLREAIVHQNITSTIRLQVTTAHKPIIGGGIANTAFLAGSDAFDANAVTATVTSTFWLEKLDHEERASQLQYTQTVLLNFDEVSWPHITVATLRRV